MQRVRGRVNVHSVMEEFHRSKERGTYNKWKDEDRFETGDYARVNEESAALQRRSIWNRWLCTCEWEFCCPAKVQVKVSLLEREYHLLIQNKSYKGDKKCFKRATRDHTITEIVLKTNRVSSFALWAWRNASIKYQDSKLLWCPLLIQV